MSVVRVNQLPDMLLIFGQQMLHVHLYFGKTEKQCLYVRVKNLHRKQCIYLQTAKQPDRTECKQFSW